MERVLNLSQFPITHIIEGGARGVDHLAYRYAMENTIPYTEYPADWSLGKHAGFLRNEKMVQDCDAMIAIWDGESKGTAHSIKLAKQYGKPYSVIKY